MLCTGSPPSSASVGVMELHGDRAVIERSVLQRQLSWLAMVRRRETRHIWHCHRLGIMLCGGLRPRGHDENRHKCSSQGLERALMGAP
eukprot:6519382-Pyramimonas_sp.AAC.1